MSLRTVWSASSYGGDCACLPRWQTRLARTVNIVVGEPKTENECSNVPSSDAMANLHNSYNVKFLLGAEWQETRSKWLSSGAGLIADGMT